MAAPKRTLTNEEKLDLFADLLEPLGQILTDEAVKEAFKTKSRLKAISVAIKRHKRTIVEMLALIDGVPPKEYTVDIVALPLRLLEFANRPEIQELFLSQAQTNAVSVSGSATENTGDGAN